MTNKKPKPKKMWAVHYKEDFIIGIAKSRESALEMALRYRGNMYEWQELEDAGYTVEKVTVTRGWGNE